MTLTVGPVRRPTSSAEIYELLERGEVSVTQAIRLFTEVERDLPQPPLPARRDAQPRQQPAVALPPAAEVGEAARVDDILSELDQLVGLTQVKALVREVRAYIEIQRRRSRENLLTEPMALHMVFSGNPGTGKTTVARLLARLFKELGVLQKGHLVEVERADLVGEYIGHTALKTREQIKRALGGILFIDEAYSLARGGEKDFGREAIDTLVRAMEENRDNLVIILAGYQREMRSFLQLNPGLKSRFPIHLGFQDFSLEQLMLIAEQMVQKRQYRLTAEAREELADYLRARLAAGDENMGNARLVRNLVERAVRRQAVRLIERHDLLREDLVTLTREDILECAV
ncbi:MAG: AAA family ATPase [Chloroflexota bacterium]